jgi:hypothetical protein
MEKAEKWLPGGVPEIKEGTLVCGLDSHLPDLPAKPARTSPARTLYEFALV